MCDVKFFYHTVLPVFSCFTGQFGSQAPLIDLDRLYLIRVFCCHNRENGGFAPNGSHLGIFVSAVLNPGFQMINSSMRPIVLFNYNWRSGMGPITLQSN